MSLRARAKSRARTVQDLLNALGDKQPELEWRAPGDGLDAISDEEIEHAPLKLVIAELDNLGGTDPYQFSPTPIEAIPAVNSAFAQEAPLLPNRYPMSLLSSAILKLRRRAKMLLGICVPAVILATTIVLTRGVDPVVHQQLVDFMYRGAGYVVYLALVLVVFLICLVLVRAFFSTFFVVSEENVAIIERLGKFVRAAEPGLRMRWRAIERVAGYVSLGALQRQIEVTTVAKDVTVLVTVSVQFRALKRKLHEAFYLVEDPGKLIDSYVRSAVHARVFELELQELYATKDDIAEAIRIDLDKNMQEFGYGIVDVLVSNIQADARVRAAIDEAKAQTSFRIAEEQKAEAEKIVVLKRAEAASAARALHGKGLADERREILKGLEESVACFQARVQGTAVHEVMTLVILTQYLDTLAQLSRTTEKAIEVPQSPAALNDIASQLKSAFMMRPDSVATSDEPTDANLRRAPDG